ncbi:MAG: hypothetical protein AAGF92_01945 [Myxococcota bacterium]
MLVSFVLWSGCELGSKSGCLVDDDCIGGLSCVDGTCFDCAADREGCGCLEGSCFGGLVCGGEDVCVSCSETDACPPGLACDQGSCVACNNTFVGCACVSDTCGPGLRCSEDAICVALTCNNAIRDGDETDVDCGGSCAPCAEGLACTASTDCGSLACFERSCLAIGSCIVRSAAYPTAQAALDDPRCSTVRLPSGLFAEQLVVDRAVTLLGEGTPEPGSSPADGETVLIGSVRSSLLTALPGDGPVVLRDLVFRDGEASTGGAVRSERDLVIERCAFIDNRAETTAVEGSNQPHACGGAVEVIDAELVVRDSVFLRNTASDVRTVPGPAPSAEAAGGAVCASGSGQIVVERSEFVENQAVSLTDVPGSALVQAGGGQARGGAIYREPGTLIVDDSTFSGNASRVQVDLDRETGQMESANGGAIYAPSESPLERVRITRSSFVDNVALADATQGLAEGAASAEAGAVFANAIDLDGVTFQDNLALAKGSGGSGGLAGALRMTLGRIEASNFWRNVAAGNTGDAGGVRVLGRTTIINSVFWNNTGSPAAAVKVTASDGDVWVVNSNFVDNYPGCGVHADRGLVRISHNASTDSAIVCGNAGSIRSEGYNVLSTLPPPLLAPHPDDLVWLEPRHEKIFSASPRPGFPLEGSPLVNGGRASGCLDEAGEINAVDNLGMTREGPCDIGAFSVSPSQDLLEEPQIMLLQVVTTMKPDLYFPDEEECSGPDTFEALSFVRGQILGDNERPPTSFRDGFIDHPVVLRIQGSSTEGSLLADLRTRACTTPLVNCNTDFALGSQTNVVFENLHLRSEGECSSGDGGLTAPSGVFGCIEGEVASGRIDIGIDLRLVDVEIVGSLDVGWTDELFATIRGFMSLDVLRSTGIPAYASEALGGAEFLSDLICDSDLELHKGDFGVFFTLEVAFRHAAAVTNADLLPPLRVELFDGYP